MQGFGKKKRNSYLFLTKVNEVLQIDILSVVDDGFIDDFGHFIPSLDRV